MKKMLYAAVMLVLLASCEKNYYLGASSSGCGGEDIEVRGNVAFVTTDEEKISISLAPVILAPGCEKIDLNDTINLVPDQVALSQLECKISKVDSKVIEHNMNYIVEKGTFEINFFNNDISIPIRFTRGTASAVRDGELKEMYGFYYNVITRYLRTDPLITNEETHSRSYFDCKIEFFDDTEKIGVIETEISFFTRNRGISFSASVQEVEECVYY